MEQRKEFIKPAKGLLIRDPQTREQLPAEGKEVVMNTYWMRRINDGDVVIAKAPKKSKKKDAGTSD